MGIVKNVIYDKAIYLELNSKEIKAVEKQAIERYQEAMGKDEPRARGELSFESTDLEVDELYYENGKLTINGNLWCDGRVLGYTGISLPLDRVVVLDIIEHYMKQLGKVKTLLEATKDL